MYDRSSSERLTLSFIPRMLPTVAVSLPPLVAIGWFKRRGEKLLGTKIAEGREAEVFAGPDDSVVKVFRPGFSGHLGEAAALRALAGTGVAPLLLDIIDVDGRVA